MYFLLFDQQVQCYRMLSIQSFSCLPTVYIYMMNTKKSIFGLGEDGNIENFEYNIVEWFEKVRIPNI